MWREDSTRADLLRLARALDQTREPGFQRAFRIAFAAAPPPRRPRYDAMETQRIVALRR